MALSASFFESALVFEQGHHGRGAFEEADEVKPG